MIFFVVLGHIVPSLASKNDTFKPLYLYIFTFHMPAFVLISGMLSKIDLDNDRIEKLIKSLIIPLIAFTVLYEIYEVMLNGEISSYTKKAMPYWILWYLLSLFCWKLMLPIFNNLRFPIFISFIVGIAAGYFKPIGYYFGISRTLYFFPFFLVGYYYSKEIMTLSERVKALKFLSLIVLVLIFAFFIFFHDISPHWLFGSYSYARLSSQGYTAALKRLFIYSISFSTVLSIMLLVPKKEMIFSAIGKNSLMVYVWHGFITKYLIKAGIIAWIGKMQTLSIYIAIFSLSSFITLVLSYNCVAKNTQRLLLYPFEKILLKK